MVNMVYNKETGRMEKVGTSKKAKNIEKISIHTDLYHTLLDYAKQDGFDLTGVTYVTQKDKDGKTIKKNGKPVFVMKDGKPVKQEVAISKGKANSAVNQYVEVAIRMLITNRK